MKPKQSKNIIIRQATIHDTPSAHHGLVRDILVLDGVIEAIEQHIATAPNCEQIEGHDLKVCPGWVDIGVQVCDPGLEHREDLASAARAGERGGFSTLFCLPNTMPAIHSKSEVNYIVNESAGLPVKMYPIGAVSVHCEGKDIAEMIDMYHAGAVAFSDGKRAIQDNGLMLRALLYAKSVNGIVMHQPLDQTLLMEGQMHEGVITASLGLKGISAMAEEIMVQRDLKLLEYTESRLHLSNLSSARSVEMVRQAKAKGLRVTASVAVLNLLLTDEALQGFDSNLKVLPPLRSEADRQALIRGLQEGVIDVLSANHVPVEEENKKLEFSYASFGAIGLETAYAACNTWLSKDISDEVLVKALSVRPREIFGLPQKPIAVGQKADLTVFSPSEVWEYNENSVLSKSRNSHLIGQQLKGRAVAVIC